MAGGESRAPKSKEDKRVEQSRLQGDVRRHGEKKGSLKHLYGQTQAPCKSTACECPMPRNQVNHCIFISLDSHCPTVDNVSGG